MNTDMSAFMGLSPNKDLKNGLIRAESVFLALHMIYIMLHCHVKVFDHEHDRAHVSVHGLHVSVHATKIGQTHA